MTSAFDFSAIALSGDQVLLSDFRNRALLIVNTASKCGFTSQYAGLQKLHEDFGHRGFAVLGFPCNQFGQQEPGSAEEIQRFCLLTYNITFPIFAKVDVNGDGAHPLFKYLKQTKPGVLGSEAIKWNFTKFLVDRRGIVIKRYAPMTKPKELRSDIDAMLTASDAVYGTPGRSFVV